MQNQVCQVFLQGCPVEHYALFLYFSLNLPPLSWAVCDISHIVASNLYMCSINLSFSIFTYPSWAIFFKALLTTSLDEPIIAAISSWVNLSMATTPFSVFPLGLAIPKKVCAILPQTSRRARPPICLSASLSRLERWERKLIATAGWVLIYSIRALPCITMDNAASITSTFADRGSPSKSAGSLNTCKLEDAVLYYFQFSKRTCFLKSLPDSII